MSELEKYRQTMSGEVLRSWAVDAQSEIDQLKAQLPEGMQDRTIVFEQCEKGHGTLRGVNWIKNPCRQCEIDRLKAELELSEETRLCSVDQVRYLMRDQEEAENKWMKYRDRVQNLERQLAEARAELARYKAVVEIVAAVDKYGELHLSKDLPHMANQRVRVLVMKKEGV